MFDMQYKLIMNTQILSEYLDFLDIALGKLKNCYEEIDKKYNKNELQVKYCIILPTMSAIQR